MDHFMVRPGGAELAKTVHSISGSITTVSLFTRLWARKQQKGLWWDDYIREWLSCYSVGNVRKTNDGN